jgi:hypothetical protein
MEKCAKFSNMNLLNLLNQICKNVWLGLQSLEKANKNGTMHVKIKIFSQEN